MSRVLPQRTANQALTGLADARINDPASERGYRYVLPRPMPGGLLAEVSRRFARNFPVEHRAIHLFAIATTGVPLAASILMYRQALAERDESVAEVVARDCLTIVVPGQCALIPPPGARRSLPILIDNSVKTGETLCQVVGTMRDSRYEIGQMVVLVDYEDGIGHRRQAEVRKRLGVRLFSLFGRSEIEGAAVKNQQAVA